MNTLFAAGLFDSPWLVAIILIVGALSNWLMKRRQEKETDHRPEGGPPASSDKPKGGFNLEEALRQLLGEEPPPAPPPIPRTTPAQPPRIEEWMEEEGPPPELVWPEERGEHPIQTMPAPRPPPIVGTISPVVSTLAAEAAGRPAAITEHGRCPAAGVEQGQAHGRRARAGRRTAFWRDPKNARQAFVASVIFAPPKGLQL